MISTRDYIKNILKSKLPNLDISDGSPLSELFVNPTAAIFDPVLVQLKYLLDNLGLKEPEKINPSELDTIAANFLIYRRQSVPSSGYVEMFFETAQNMSIPKDTTFTASDGRIYVVTKTFPVAESTMQANLWKFPLYSTGLIPVTAQFDTLGTPLEPGSIVSTSFEPAPVQVTNPVAFSAGVIAETNTELAERLVNAVMNRSLASEQSYVNLITENFPSVKETIVVGAGDDRMVRDLHHSGIEALENYYLVDYRGKISVSDFYINASGGYYIKTSGIFDETPNFDEYPYTQSKAYWTLFYDDPASSGLVYDIPEPDEFVLQFSTGQYANMYYLYDAYRTVLHTAILLQDPFVGGALDSRWWTGDAHTNSRVTKSAYEIQPTDNGVRLGYTPDLVALAQVPVAVSKKFLELVKQMLQTSLALDPAFAQHINLNAISPELLSMMGIEPLQIEYRGLEDR